MEAKTTRSPVLRIAGAQLAATVVVAMLLMGYATPAAYAAALGGIIIIIAHAYAGWRIFSRSERISTDYKLYNFYRAELGKLVVIGALCGLVFVAVPTLHIAGFLAGLVVALLTGPIAAATVKTDQVVAAKHVD